MINVSTLLHDLLVGQVHFFFPDVQHKVHTFLQDFNPVCKATGVSPAVGAHQRGVASAYAAWQTLPSTASLLQLLSPSGIANKTHREDSYSEGLSIGQGHSKPVQGHVP
jgi:hypothetical protein